jgi:hypothetical protein
LSAGVFYLFTFGVRNVPKILIDKEELLREIDDLVRVNDDAGVKASALADAIEQKDLVAAAGEKLLIETTDKVDQDNKAASDAVTTAEVASKVADELLTRQIDHLKKRIAGEEDADPTPKVEQLELDI